MHRYAGRAKHSFPVASFFLAEPSKDRVNHFGIFLKNGPAQIIAIPCGVLKEKSFRVVPWILSVFLPLYSLLWSLDRKQMTVRSNGPEK